MSSSTNSQDTLLKDLEEIVTLLKNKGYQCNNIQPIDHWLIPIEDYISNPTDNTEELWRDLCNLFGVAAACNCSGSIPDDTFNLFETYINDLKSKIRD
jgi:hypothetical protein